MESKYNYLRELDSRIKLIEKAATELSVMGKDRDIPAVYKNAKRILASVNMLKIEVSDILDLGI